MRPTRTVLFLQFPQWDNDVTGAGENLHYAAACLRHAAERAGEGTWYRMAPAPARVERLDDHHAADDLAALAPDVLVATLYLWNIERTVRVLDLLRARRPGLHVAVGGPEVAPGHPFLFRSRAIDYAAVGEGEPVFPAILRAFRGGPVPDFATVFCRTPTGFRPGRHVPAPLSLEDILPPVSLPGAGPDRRGVAYLETSRGCRLRCAYCRYPHMRRTMTFLPPDAVRRRLAALRRAGAREIRCIDPTFNAHPAFPQVLSALAAANPRRRMAFFAELRAETLHARDADLLRRANVVEVEVGLQSCDPRVLRAIRRPTDLAALDRGLRRLLRRRIRVTLDVMYGLPHQAAADVRRSLRYALRIRRVNVQCLQTLLLPATELRARRRSWGLTASPRPPYGVLATPALPPRALAAIEALIERTPRLRSDCPAERFVGRALPDLFPEQVVVRIDRLPAPTSLPGSQGRRAMLVRGADLFARCGALCRLVQAAVTREPHVLWQFVLEPETEEPLDLLDRLVATLRRLPPHLLDRYAGPQSLGRLASRRLFLRLHPRRRWDPGWVRAADALLCRHFL